MTTATDTRSGKGHRDENFPVASHLIRRRHRGPILAFYRFVRAADDVADHAALTPDEKLALLDRLAAALTGAGPSDPEAEPLKRALAERGLSPRHALDLLDAFRMDARQARYRTWDELIGYCALSAMPVGRYVLDVHGESPATWGASDQLCAALQIVNHLQDCGKDYRSLDRVYLPLDALDRHGARVEDLAAPQATAALRAVITELARRTDGLLDRAAPLSDEIADLGLALEVAAIHRLARHLNRVLQGRDPLSERVHHGRAGFLAVGLAGVIAALLRRGLRRRTRRIAAERGT